MTNSLTLRLLFTLFPSFGFLPGQGQEEPTYRIAEPGYVYSFPHDHGSHPEFRIEWWYLTGHLFARDERRFGFEATFFRLAQRADAQPENSAFGTGQIYLAHMAVSDLGNQRFYHEERLNREGWNAYAKVGDLDVRNGNWSLKRKPDGEIILQGSIQSDCSFSLSLVPEKPHVIFGEDGISRKGPSESAASHYITFTRLRAKGRLSIAGEDLEVEGSTWMDHEISSSQLDENQTGWDWVSVQFDDGRELMAYMLRLRDGGYSDFSRLVWISREGELVHHPRAEIEWIPGGYWESPDTGARYPIRPVFKTVDPASGKRRTFTVVPLMEEQEITGELTGVPYWEGACDIVDENNRVVGRAYLELAGYVDGLNDRLR